MHGAKEISASLKTYNIPKKKAKKDTQPAVDISKPSVTWKDALPGSAEFKSIEEILSSSEYRERNLRFKLDNVKLIENHFLKHRFETYRQKLKENRQPSGETVAFIQLGFEDAEREYLALNGVAVGASFNTDLGNPEHGVYLFNKFDLVSPQPLFTESDVVVPDVRSGRIKSQVPLRILICKVLRGRQYTVGLGSTDLDPVPGYGCHVVQRNTMEFPRTSLEKYRNNAIYVYEHDDALGIVEVPSGILPYAVVDVLPFSSKECKSIKEKLDNRNLPVYNPTNPLYVGQFTMLSRQFVLTLVGNANDAAKVLGIDPSLDFYIMQSWEMLSENGEFVTPFQELLTSKCGQLATTRELELSRGGNFVAYFMLQCLDRSPEEKRHFAEFCDRVRLERGSLCCATFENFRVYCIPSSELTARMGFAWPREPTMHLLMQCKKRSFYFEPGEETMSSVGYSKEAMRRNPTPNDYVKGSDWLLKDMADEAYRLIAETTGNKGHNHIWRCINPDKQFPRPADLEKLPEADWDKEPMQAPPPKPQRRPAHAHPPPTPDSDSTPASVQSRQEEDMDIDEENQDSQDSPSPSVHQVDPRRVRSPPPHAPPQNDENPRDPRSFYRGDPRVQPPRPVLLGTPGDPRLPSGVLRDPRRPQHSGADYPPKDPRSNQHVDGENEMGDCVVVEYADSQSTDADDERSPLEADERRSPEMAEIEIIQLSSDEEEEEHAMDISEPEQEEEEPGEASPGERDGEPTDSLDPRSPSSSPAEECGTEETGNEKVEEVEIEERSATPDLPPVQKAWMWDPRRRPPPKKCPRHAETQRPTASVPPRQQPSPTPSPVLLLELPQQAPPRDAPMLPFEVTPPPPPPLPTRFTRPWQWPRPVVYPVRPPPGWGQPGQGGGFPVPPPIPPPGVPPPPHHSPPGNWMAPHLNMPPPPLPSNGYFNNGPRQDYFNGGFQLPQHQPPFMNNFGNNVFGPQGDTWRRSNVRFNDEKLEEVRFITPEQKLANEQKKRMEQAPSSLARPPPPTVPGATPTSAPKSSDAFRNMFSILKSGQMPSSTSEPVSLAAFKLPGSKDANAEEKSMETPTETPVPGMVPPADGTVPATTTPAARRKRVTELPLPVLASKHRDPLDISLDTVEEADKMQIDSGGESDAEPETQEKENEEKTVDKKDEYDPASVEFVDSDEDDDKEVLMVDEEIEDAPSPGASDECDSDAGENFADQKPNKADIDVTKAAEVPITTQAASSPSRRPAVDAASLVMRLFNTTANNSEQAGGAQDTEKRAAMTNVTDFLSKFIGVTKAPSAVFEQADAEPSVRTPKQEPEEEEGPKSPEPEAPASPVPDDVPQSPPQEDTGNGNEVRVIPVDGDEDSDYRFPSTARRSRFDTTGRVPVLQPFGSSEDVDLRVAAPIAKKSSQSTDVEPPRRPSIDEALKKINLAGINQQALNDVKQILARNKKPDDFSIANGVQKTLMESLKKREIQWEPPEPHETARYTQLIMKNLVKGLNLNKGVVHNLKSINVSKESDVLHMSSVPNRILPAGVNKIMPAEVNLATTTMPSDPRAMSASNVWNSTYQPHSQGLPGANVPTTTGQFGHRGFGQAPGSHGYGQAQVPDLFRPGPSISPHSRGLLGDRPGDVPYPNPGTYLHHPAVPTIGTHGYGSTMSSHLLGQQAAAQAMAAQADKTYPSTVTSREDLFEDLSEKDQSEGSQLNRKLRRKLAKGEVRYSPERRVSRSGRRRANFGERSLLPSAKRSDKGNPTLLFRLRIPASPSKRTLSRTEKAKLRMLKTAKPSAKSQKALEPAASSFAARPRELPEKLAPSRRDFDERETRTEATRYRSVEDSWTEAIKKKQSPRKESAEKKSERAQDKDEREVGSRGEGEMSTEEAVKDLEEGEIEEGEIASSEDEGRASDAKSAAQRQEPVEDVDERVAAYDVGPHPFGFGRTPSFTGFSAAQQNRQQQVAASVAQHPAVPQPWSLPGRGRGGFAGQLPWTQPTFGQRPPGHYPGGAPGYPGARAQMGAPRPDIHQPVIDVVTIVVLDHMLFNLISNMKSWILEEILDHMDKMRMNNEAKMFVYVHHHIMELIKQKIRDLAEDSRCPEYRTCLELFKKYEERKIAQVLPVHGCDTAGTRSKEVTLQCLREIREHQTHGSQSRIIYLSKMSPQSEAGSELLGEGFMLMSPEELVSNLHINSRG